MQGSNSRYLMQMQLPRFGAEGQQRLRQARILLAGCGALGSVAAEQLARAGVGTLVVVDRDLVEWSNLQRQTLFTESDARRRVPKAEAAKARLAQVHAPTSVRAFVDDLAPASVHRYVEDVDLIIDCLDNFETRYLLNDCSVKYGKPLVYGGAVGLRGMAALFLPISGADRSGLVEWPLSRATPCLRCVAPEPPLPGEVETCETAGVLAATAGVVASIEAALAIRAVAEGTLHVPSTITRIDLEAMRFESASIEGARDPACPCCGAGRFEFLHPAGDADASRTRALCGRNAVEISLCGRLDDAAFARVAARLGVHGALRCERHGETRALAIELPSEAEVVREAEVAREAEVVREAEVAREGELPREAELSHTPAFPRASHDSSQVLLLTLLAGEVATLAIVSGTTDT